jgi:TolA-binding protein
VERPSTGDPAEDGYVYGFRLWQAKMYSEAEAALKQVADKYPNHRRASFAQNLLGRAYLDDGKPALAAVALYDSYKKWPKGERAAESLYWLGQALTDLKKPADACKVYAQFGDDYAATASASLKAQVAAGQKRAKCA